MGLTDEQKKRIESKKAEALARLKTKQAASSSNVQVNNNIPGSANHKTHLFTAYNKQIPAASAIRPSSLTCLTTGQIHSRDPPNSSSISSATPSTTLAANSLPLGASGSLAANILPPEAAGSLAANSIPPGASGSLAANSLPPGVSGSLAAKSLPPGASGSLAANSLPPGASGSLAAKSLPPGASGSLAATTTATGQKEAIEKKRQEALQRKRTHVGISPGKGINTNSLTCNPGKGINTNSLTSNPGQGINTNSLLSNQAKNPLTVNKQSSNTISLKKPTFENYYKDVQKTVPTSNFYSGSSDKSSLNKSPVNPYKSSSLFGFGQSSKVVKAVFELKERNRFEVRGGYDEGLINLFQNFASRSYNAKTRTWSFHLDDHDKLVKQIRQLQQKIDLTSLPKWILDTFRNPKDYHLEDIDLSTIEQSITDSLMPFQREGIRYAISRNGRVLIADDMGLGKTIQALGLASYYMDQETWPFLVVAPSSMRYTWQTSILRWFPYLTADHVTIINKGKDSILDNKEAAVIIISYNLLSSKSAELLSKGFKLVIMDESHCIKNDKSARTKAAEPIMQKSKYLILLTGTPALSRPIELYSQISALHPKLFKNSFEFGLRYCDAQQKKIGYKDVWDYSGSSNMQELSLLLQEKFMIRRLKSEVLLELPSKLRCMVLLDPGSVDTSSKAIKDKEKAAMSKSVSGGQRRALIMEWYNATATAKLKAVKEYVADLVTTGKKFLLFCHHQIMITGLKETLESKKIDYILIDGSTKSSDRKDYVDKFQKSDKCQVALLSIMAANSGLTLTAAQLVVFAELFWNPGILTQAEDRAHRIGQTDSVTIQYLVARNTADDELWPMIQKKLDVLNKAGLTKDNFQESAFSKFESKGQKRMEDFFSVEDSLTEDMFDDSWDTDLAAMDVDSVPK